MYGIDGMRLGGANGYEQADRNPITAEELKRAYESLYLGREMKLIDYRNSDLNPEPGSRYLRKKRITDSVSAFTKFIVCFESGLSYTMQEYAAYLRDPSRPLGEAMS